MAASASSHSQNVTCCKTGIQVNFKEEEKEKKDEKKTRGHSLSPLVGTSPNPSSHPQAKRSPPLPQSSQGKK
jgi:hypothetical protein